jgi:hypothetical protein
MVASGFLAEVEHVDLDELKKKHPAAFDRPYDPGAGLILERIIDH